MVLKILINFLGKKDCFPRSHARGVFERCDDKKAFNKASIFNE